MPQAKSPTLLRGDGYAQRRDLRNSFRNQTKWHPSPTQGIKRDSLERHTKKPRRSGAGSSLFALWSFRESQEPEIPGTRGKLIRHHDRIDHVDHSIGLEYVGDRDRGRATFFVLQDDVLAVLHDPQFAAFARSQFRFAAACLDHLHQFM